MIERRTLDTSPTSPHQPDDADKLEVLADDMRGRGWVGAPLVVVEDPGYGLVALCGSHRIAAAQATDTPIAALVVSAPEGDADAAETIVELCQATDPEERRALLRELAELTGEDMSEAIDALGDF